MIHRIAIVSLLLPILFAGCNQPSNVEDGQASVGGQPEAAAANATIQVPADRYLNATLEDLDFTASDGTRIHATVYVPTEPRPGFRQETRFGTIVQFADYYTASGDDATDSKLNNLNADHPLNQTGPFGLLVSHGFAYVATSAPGTGASGGCFDFGGPHDQQAVAEFVDWVATQPWSTGNVGMSGGNFAGAAQWMAAIAQPQHLKTIVPHVSFTDFYKLVFHDGAAYQDPDPAVISKTEIADYGFNWDDPDESQVHADAVHHLCPAVADHLVTSANGLVKGVYDEFWHQRDYTARLDQIRASVFFVHGLKDVYARPTHALGWSQVTAEKAYWLQQMDSTAPFANRYNKSDNRPDYRQTLLAWYDHYLNGVDNGIPHTLPAVQVEDDSGYWRNETRWPPMTQPRVLHLAQGALRDESDHGSTTLASLPTGATITPMGQAQKILDNPLEVLPPEAAPVMEVVWPAVQPAWNATSPYRQEAGGNIPTRKDVDDQQMPDSIVGKFYSDPLSQPLRLSGVPFLNLSLQVDQPGYGHVVAQLWNQKEDGNWTRLAIGGRGLAQRDGRDHDDPAPAMTPLAVPLEFEPIEAYLPAGARLVLTVAANNPWFTPGNEPTIILDHTSSLTLPVLPAETPRGVPTAAYVEQNPYWDGNP